MQWQFEINGEQKLLNMKLPTLFVIGDTEGHDKMCGRMGCRRVISHLCRYCNTDRENIDNPHFKYEHTKMKDVTKLIAKNKEDDLKKMSMFCVKNAWHDLQYCDPNRGLHGATLAELLHCLQQGLFDYAIQGLFGAKKTTKKKNTKTKSKKRKQEIAFAPTNIENDEYVAPTNTSNFYVFSDSYVATFEVLCLQYGKYLQHQSDRTIPRTVFNI